MMTTGKWPVDTESNSDLKYGENAERISLCAGMIGDSWPVLMITSVQ